MNASHTERPALWIMIGLACGVLALVHLVVVWLVPGLPGDRVLLDTDAYMWLNRVIHLAETGAWFEHTYPRINPPEGHEQHWTRPFDVVLLVGGAALGWIWGFDTGLYVWGVLVSPLLHLLTLGAFVWALQPLVRRKLAEARATPMVLLVFLVQASVYPWFLAGRPDHHALLGFLFVTYLGFWLRVLLDDGNGPRSAVGLGLVAALALWVNVEALLFVTLGMAGLGLSWLFGNPVVAVRAAVHGLVLIGGAIVAIGIQWGGRAPTVREMDTLSVPHVGLLALSAGFWCLLWWVSGRKAVQRLAGRAFVCAGGAIGVLGAVYVLFPEFYASPLEGVDPLYAETRLTLLRELQPLPALGEGFLGGMGVVTLLVGGGMISIPYSLLRTFSTIDREERVVWLVFALTLTLYVGMALHQRRWADYAGLATVVPFTLLCVDALRRAERRTSPTKLWMVRSLILAGLLVGPLLLGGTLTALAGPAHVAEELRERAERWWDESPEEPVIRLEDRGTGSDCDLVQVGEVLAGGEEEDWFAHPRLVLAHTDHGPQLLYRTNHAVLSIPNHRPQPGYTFMHRVMRHPDAGEASAMLRERGVEIIVLCREDVTSGFFRYPEGEAFAHWLAEGGVPEGFVLHAASPSSRVYQAQGPEAGAAESDTGDRITGVDLSKVPE